jgi:hypothetical protein
MAEVGGAAPSSYQRIKKAKAGSVGRSSCKRLQFPLKYCLAVVKGMDWTLSYRIEVVTKLCI